MATTTPRSVRWLLVHDLHDSTAPWLAALWRQRLGPRAGELLVLPAPAITLGGRWQLRVQGSTTQSCLVIEQGQGAQLQRLQVHSDTLRGVLHRPHQAWVPEKTADRDYVAQERQALLLAWLHGLGERCMNAPTAGSLAGPAWSGAQWRWQAHRMGLPVQAGPDIAPQAVLPLLRLVVAGDHVFSVNGQALPAAWQAGARRLAAAAGCRLLGLYAVDGGPDGWHFVQASVQPDLRAAGPAVAQALAAAMCMPEPEAIGLCA